LKWFIRATEGAARLRSRFFRTSIKNARKVTTTENAITPTDRRARQALIASAGVMISPNRPGAGSREQGQAQTQDERLPAELPRRNHVGRIVRVDVGRGLAAKVTVANIANAIRTINTFFIAILLEMEVRKPGTVRSEMETYDHTNKMPANAQAGSSCCRARDRGRRRRWHGIQPGTTARRG